MVPDSDRLYPFVDAPPVLGEVSAECQGYLPATHDSPAQLTLCENAFSARRELNQDRAVPMSAALRSGLVSIVHYQSLDSIWCADPIIATHFVNSVMQEAALGYSGADVGDKEFASISMICSSFNVLSPHAGSSHLRRRNPHPPQQLMTKLWTLDRGANYQAPYDDRPVVSRALIYP